MPSETRSRIDFLFGSFLLIVPIVLTGKQQCLRFGDPRPFFIKRILATGLERTAVVVPQLGYALLFAGLGPAE